MNTVTINGIRIFEVPADGPPLGSERDALDLIGAAYGQEIGIIAIPVARLDPQFLKLRTGMAGAFLQKLQNYGYRCALVGDISAALAASSALRDFVYESNKIGQVLFVEDNEDLRDRLTS
jgi:hypothetical protein